MPILLLCGDHTESSFHSQGKRAYNLISNANVQMQTDTHSVSTDETGRKSEQNNKKQSKAENYER